MDFFTVEVVTLTGLVRYHVLFVIDLARRRGEFAGIVHEPHEAWMKQIARYLTDAVHGFLLANAISSWIATRCLRQHSVRCSPARASRVCDCQRAVRI